MAASKPELDANNFSRPNKNDLAEPGEGVTELFLVINTATENRESACAGFGSHRVNFLHSS